MRHHNAVFDVSAAGKALETLEHFNDRLDLVKNGFGCQATAATLCHGRANAEINPRRSRVDKGFPAEIDSRAAWLGKVGQGAAVNLERRACQYSVAVRVRQG